MLIYFIAYYFRKTTRISVECLINFTIVLVYVFFLKDEYLTSRRTKNLERFYIARIFFTYWRHITYCVYRYVCTSCLYVLCMCAWACECICTSTSLTHINGNFNSIPNGSLSICNACMSWARTDRCMTVVLIVYKSCDCETDPAIDRI